MHAKHIDNSLALVMDKSDVDRQVRLLGDHASDFVAVLPSRGYNISPHLDGGGNIEDDSRARGMKGASSSSPSMRHTVLNEDSRHRPFQLHDRDHKRQNSCPSRYQCDSQSVHANRSHNGMFSRANTVYRPHSATRNRSRDPSLEFTLKAVLRLP